MRFKREKIMYVLAIVFFMFVIASFCGCSANASKENKKKAEKLYEKGNTEEAKYLMALYLQDFPTDIDANILLADWYSADNPSKALIYYRKAARSKEYEENSLNYNHVSEIITGNIESFIIKPSAKYTRAMNVVFSSNFFSIDTNSENGKIDKNNLELSDEQCKTSAWFPVNSAAEEITVYGKINCAVYQFMDKDGKITYFKDDSTFNDDSSIRFSNKAYSTMDIPKDAVKARITYYDSTIENTVNLENGVYVQYGSFVQGYTDEKVQIFEIPDLKEDEYIEYRDGKWNLYANDNIINLNFEKVSEDLQFVSVEGELVGELNYRISEKTAISDKSKIYGISYKQNTTNFSCERTDDAKYMNFNFVIDDEWANFGENDFDQAYPWSDIKRCNIQIKDGNTVITYEDESGYLEDGSNGNVMVEIPKFYTKRVVENGYEYIAISGMKHQGYQLDPAFIGNDGRELEHIYVGAYLGSKQQGDVMQSISGAFPEMKMYLNDAVRSAEGNGSGYGEIDYVTYSALQKLFIIETGNINSSSIFSGDTANNYFYEDANKSSYALYDEKNSNRIVLKANTFTSRLMVGDSVTIFNGWEEYENTADYQREIENITRDSAKNIIITFTGNPIDIEAGKSAISNIPIKNGKTDEIDYCTGINDRGAGKSPFKYRGIENLYGSVMTIIDKATFKQDTFSYETADGKVHILNFYPPIQMHPFTDVEQINRNFTIKSMGYDSENPLIMLPSELGNGASGVSSYGDFWMLYLTENYETMRYLTVGGANDNFSLAGLFHMRVHFSTKWNNNENSGYIGARIMYK